MNPLEELEAKMLEAMKESGPPPMPPGDQRPIDWTVELHVKHDQPTAHPTELVDAGVDWHRAETSPPISANMLEHWSEGLTPADEARLSASAVDEVFAATVTRERSAAAVREFFEQIGRYVDQVHGFVVDGHTRRIHSQTSWRVRVEGWTDDTPDVEAQIKLHAYQKLQDQARIVTLGMPIFGLPELEIDGCSPRDFGLLGGVVNLAAASLIEDGLIQDGSLSIGSGSIEVTPRWAEQGDHSPWVLSLQIPAPEATTQARFTTGVRDRPEAKEVQRTLFELKMAYSMLPPGHTLLVKGPFEDEDAVEWMWVEILSWEDTTLHGTLDHDARMMPLRQGARVTVAETDVVAWAIYQGATEIDSRGISSS